MIPTLEDIIRGLLDGSVTYEQARRWLQCHEDLQEQVDAVSTVPYESAVCLLDIIHKLDEQNKRWGPREYPGFDAQLMACADTTPKDLASYHELPTADVARAMRGARQGELSWADILVCEVAKTTECYERPGDLRKQLIDVAGVAVQWAASLVKEPQVVVHTVNASDGVGLDATISMEADHEGPNLR